MPAMSDMTWLYIDDVHGEGICRQRKEMDAPANNSPCVR